MIGHGVGQRPCRFHLAAGFQSHLHDATDHDVRVGWNGTAQRNFLRRAAQHGGEAEEVALFEVVIRRVVAARALHLHAHERLRHDLRLLRQRHVVLRGEAEARRPAIIRAALHENQFRDEPVHRLVVREGFVDVPAERPRVVQHGLHDAGIFREHILPVTHPMIRPRRVLEKTINRFRAPVVGRLTEKLVQLLNRRPATHGVERDAAEEGVIINQRGRFRVLSFEFRVDETIQIILRRLVLHGGNFDGRQLRHLLARAFVTHRPILVFACGQLAASFQIFALVKTTTPRLIPAPRFIRQRDARPALGTQPVKHLRAFRGKAHGQFADFGTALLESDDRLDHHDVFRAVAWYGGDGLALPRTQVTHVRSERQRHFRHFLVAVRTETLKFHREQRLPIEEKSRARADAKQQTLFTAWQDHSGRSAEEKWGFAIRLDALGRILRRQHGESECRLGVGLAHRRVREIPTELIRQSFKNFHTHRVARQFAGRHLRRIRLSAQGRDEQA